MFQNSFVICLAVGCLTALLGYFYLPLGILAAIVAAWLFQRRVERFLKGLRAYAEKISIRDFDSKFDDEERGHLAFTQLSFESMAFDLKAAFERESRQRLRIEMALRGIQDGVLVLDKDGKVLFANPSAQLFFQIEEFKEGGPHYWELLREPEITDLIKQVLAFGGTQTRELPVYRIPERHLFMAATALLQRGSSSPTGAVVLFYDRTEQKRLEKMRSDFAANVSHELRTPLTAIKAALETLAEGALDDPKVNRSFLEKAIHHAERLYELISDLLALASIEEDRRLGRIPSGVAAFLREACEETLQTLEASVSRQDGQVQLELPPHLPAMACDPAALRQILVNLVENALKYSGPKPRVRILAREDVAALEVSVQDEGPGIPAEDLNRIFERFYRVDKARTRQAHAPGGSGLGLAIVKHLVENYGGSVGVENLTERGCRFWFRIPKAA